MNRRNRRRRRFPRFILLLIILIALALVVFVAVRLFSDRKKSDAGPAGENSTVTASAAVPAGTTSQAGVTASAGSSVRADSSASAGNPSPASSDAAGEGGLSEPAGAAASAGTGGTAAEPGTRTESQDFSAASGTTDVSAISSTEASAAEEEKDHTATELETGREYLARLEQRTPVEMEVLIDEARKQYDKIRELKEYAEKREEYRAMLEGDAVWESFDDYAFLGDSRVMGFSSYGFLSGDRVLAATGDTINAIGDRLEEIRNLSPKSVFISYGINDIGTGLWPDADGYAEALADQLDSLQEALPEAEIYVNSILPATEEAIAYGPAWAGLPEYSEAVRKMCEEKGFGFIDNTSLVEKHGDLYTGDGVHLEPDFYRYWAENQLLAVYDRKHGKLTFAENGAAK